VAQGDGPKLKPQYRKKKKKKMKQETVQINPPEDQAFNLPRFTWTDFRPLGNKPFSLCENKSYNLLILM
jgi:hypothetical protein